MSKSLLSLCLIALGPKAFGSWFSRSCNPQVIRFEHSSEFSLTIGNKKWAETGAENLRVDMPVTIDNQEGCFSQEHSYRFSYEKEPERWSGEIEAEMPEIEFIDIKDPHVETYVAINHKGSPWEAELIFSTFVCSNDSLMAVQSYRSRVSDIVNFIGKNQSAGFKTVFATGAVARNWQANQGRNHSLSSPNEEFFVTEYFKRIKEPEDGRVGDSTSVQVPEVWLSSQLHTQMTNQSLSLKSGERFRFGCTSEFKSIMSDFHIENLGSENKNGLQTEVDSNKIRLSW